MKTVFVFLVSLCLYGMTFAQINFKVEKVSAEDVPADAIANQASNFSATVISWERQTANARGRSITRYVSTFTEQTKTLTRGRYTEGGAPLTATTYYRAAQLPTAIQEAAATNYPGYTLESGEKIVYIPNKQHVFRLRLRKGAQKLVVYVDNNGEELDEDSLPEPMVEDENTPH